MSSFICYVLYQRANGISSLLPTLQFYLPSKHSRPRDFGKFYFTMCQFKSPPTLEQLLNYCCDTSSPCWTCGWKEFVKRYKRFLYMKVKQRCYVFKIPRLGLQLSETVKDIVAEVYIELCKNQCQALRTVKAPNNELKFLAWLATICNRTTYRYLEKFFPLPELTVPPDFQIQQPADSSQPQIPSPKNLNQYVAELEFDVRWELYDALIYKVRSSGKREKRNMERDLNIFLLYIWADFSPEMIPYYPCLKAVNPQMVFVVVTRIRSYLRGDKNF